MYKFWHFSNSIIFNYPVRIITFPQSVIHISCAGGGYLDRTCAIQARHHPVSPGCHTPTISYPPMLTHQVQVPMLFFAFPYYFSFYYILIVNSNDIVRDICYVSDILGYFGIIKSFVKLIFVLPSLINNTIKLWIDNAL